MDWTLILTVSVSIASAIATIFNFYNRRKAAIVFTLSATIISGISAFIQKKDFSNEVPAITGSNLGNSLRVIMVNVDRDLPLKDVSIKMQGQAAINLGTLNPRVVNLIGDFTFPKYSTTLILVAWYNGNKSMEVDFNITFNSDSTRQIDTKYFEKGIEFVPDWKNIANKFIDTAIQHYDPTMFK